MMVRATFLYSAESGEEGFEHLAFWVGDGLVPAFFPFLGGMDGIRAGAQGLRLHSQPFGEQLQLVSCAGMDSPFSQRLDTLHGN
ncbi:MAG: hypothetical protein LBU11_07305 [Zoogloeaceae bacterium]|jgi:hypothetical protein|nr:hypothetical protein [Zoogloeaceae bacterium]